MRCELQNVRVGRDAEPAARAWLAALKRRDRARGPMARLIYRLDIEDVERMAERVRAIFRHADTGQSAALGVE